MEPSSTVMSTSCSLARALMRSLSSGLQNLASATVAEMPRSSKEAWAARQFCTIVPYPSMATRVPSTSTRPLPTWESKKHHELECWMEEEKTDGLKNSSEKHQICYHSCYFPSLVYKIKREREADREGSKADLNRNTLIVKRERDTNSIAPRKSKAAGSIINGSCCCHHMHELSLICWCHHNHVGQASHVGNIKSSTVGGTICPHKPCSI